jgi:hypothetical protein
MAPVRFASVFVLSDLIAKRRAEAHYVRVDPVSTHCLKWPVIFGRSVGKVTGLVRSRTWGPALGPSPGTRTHAMQRVLQGPMCSAVAVTAPMRSTSWCFYAQPVQLLTQASPVGFGEGLCQLSSPASHRRAAA